MLCIKESQNAKTKQKKKKKSGGNLGRVFCFDLFVMNQRRFKVCSESVTGEDDLIF